jgi:hypothetical protein
MKRAGKLLRWLFAPGEARDGLIARWIFLRALAAIYFSAFLSLIFQIKRLIGPLGILPAGQYLAAVGRAFGGSRYFHAPSVFWFSSSATMLMAVTWIGIAASVLAFLNILPRLMFLICFASFLSFISAASVFSSYQSDGMLLEAGFLALFFSPPGVMPGWGADHAPSRASLFLLQWEWFRIYFESGLVKILSGDLQWRNLTAMDGYYQNSPLPTWIGWYVGHLPHWFHASTVVLTFVVEFGVVFLLFFPRHVRRICFCIVTAWEIGVILTGNYAFLNYIVLALGFLLLDDGALRGLILVRFRPASIGAEMRDESNAGSVWRRVIDGLRLTIVAVFLTWIAYATAAELVLMVAPAVPLYNSPIRVLEPFRIANEYGLFAVMTRGRYEIEFQGSDDGVNWQPYIFRYKPQLLNEAPGIYAPYQPRFDWNLWFASLGEWRQNEMVPITEERLLENDRDVLSLFRSAPFGSTAPRLVRAVLWQYWFTSIEEKRHSGNWWVRKELDLYAPVITRDEHGGFKAVEMPDALPDHD